MSQEFGLGSVGWFFWFSWAHSGVCGQLASLPIKYGFMHTSGVGWPVACFCTTGPVIFQQLAWVSSPGEWAGFQDDEQKHARPLLAWLKTGSVYLLLPVGQSKYEGSTDSRQGRGSGKFQYKGTWIRGEWKESTYNITYALPFLFIKGMVILKQHCLISPEFFLQLPLYLQAMVSIMHRVSVEGRNDMKPQSTGMAGIPE